MEDLVSLKEELLQDNIEAELLQIYKSPQQCNGHVENINTGYLFASRAENTFSQQSTPSKSQQWSWECRSLGKLLFDILGNYKVK